MAVNPKTPVARLLSAAASVNATLVKARWGTVRFAFGYNAAAAVRYLKIYDTAVAPDETMTPTLTLALPPGAGFAFDDLGEFADGIGYRLTTGNADSDTGALTAGDVLGLNIGYT